TGDGWDRAAKASCNRPPSRVVAPEVRYSFSRKLDLRLPRRVCRERRYVMSTSMIAGIIVLIAAVVVIGVISYVAALRNRTSALRSQYGSEYDRTVRHASSRRAAEAELAKRQDRVENLDIRPLLAEQRELYDQQWHDLQEMFVEDPGGAVNHADSLVMDV